MARAPEHQHRPLSAEELQSRKAPSATENPPYATREPVARTIYVGARTGVSLSPRVEVERIRADGEEPSLWKVTLQVEGAISDHLSGRGVHRIPIPRGRKPVSAGRALESFRPPWLDVSFLPKSQPKPRRPKILSKGREVDPLIVFPDDRRQILVDTSWPWLLTGKVFTSDGKPGSGVLIGNRLVLTARHVVPWNSIAAGSWWMKFVPHYFDGSEPFGHSFTSDVRTYGTDDSEFNMSHDYAVMRLYDPLGSQLGFLGYNSFDDDWRGKDVWLNIGYHDDIAGGQRPAWQRYSIEDDYEDDDGQTLETEASLEHGSSGGPFFDWFTDGHIYVVGVVGGETLFNGDRDNRLAGGDNMLDLIGWARSNWP